MAIDGCQLPFHEIANNKLPALLKTLRQNMQHKAHSMELFADKGPKTCCRECGVDDDFSGCYVLMENDEPIYVGISRKVITRLRQHVNGRTHYDASLAYRIASKDYSHEMQRSKAMEHPPFMQAFNDAKRRLRQMKVAFIEIECPVELYLFEVYCSMELKTHQWNTFRTH